MMLLFASNTSFPIAISLKYSVEPFTINDQVRTYINFSFKIVIIYTRNHTFLLCFNCITGKFAWAMVCTLVSCSWEKIPMTRPNRCSSSVFKFNVQVYQKDTIRCLLYVNLARWPWRLSHIGSVTWYRRVGRAVDLISIG